MNIISKSLLTLSLGTLVSFASAADEHAAKKVEVKDLPAPVAAALAKVGEVKEVTEKEKDGKVVYKAEVKTADGKTEAVWVDAKGEIVKEKGEKGEKGEKEKAEKKPDAPAK
jgi:uncharacterized membrane protein YkoI